jgi:hypothetical protein
MRLYRVNYEEYLHFEEFIEASSAEEAERQFRNSIGDLEPVEGETYTLDVEPVILESEKKGVSHVANS